MSSAHTAIYARVSSKSQDLASQLPDLEKWERAHDAPALWYHDYFRGKTLDRPGWSKLERAIEAGSVSRVVVWRLDRLGRTAKGLTALFDDLVKRGVGLVSVRDGLDLATPAGRLMAHVLASVAQYETEVRSELNRAIRAEQVGGDHCLDALKALDRLRQKWQARGWSERLADIDAALSRVHHLYALLRSEVRRRYALPPEDAR